MEKWFWILKGLQASWTVYTILRVAKGAASDIFPLLLMSDFGHEADCVSFTCNVTVLTKASAGMPRLVAWPTVGAQHVWPLHKCVCLWLHHVLKHLQDTHPQYYWSCWVCSAVSKVLNVNSFGPRQATHGCFFQIIKMSRQGLLAWGGSRQIMLQSMQVRATD